MVASPGRAVGRVMRKASVLLADQQGYLTALLDEWERRDARISRPAQALAGADVEPASVPGAGEHGALDRAAGECGSSVRAAVRHRVPPAGHVIDSERAGRRVLGTEDEPEASGSIGCF